MSKLLRADFERIRKSKSFWIVFLALSAYGLVILINNYRSAVKWQVPFGVTFSESLFQMSVLTGITTAVFGSLFTGTEYSDGTIRNKLTAGHTRTSIFLSNYISCAIAGIVTAVAAFAVVFTVGFCLMGRPERTVSQIFRVCIVLVFLCAAYAAVFHLISILVSSKAHAAVVNILLACGLLVAVMIIQTQLQQPEKRNEYQVTSEGGIVVGEEVPNPHYVAGAKREVYEFLLDLLPAGQTFQMILSESVIRVYQHWQLLCLYSGIIIIASSLTGICLFEKKDIK